MPDVPTNPSEDSSPLTSLNVAARVDKLTLPELLALSDEETEELQRYLNAEPLVKVSLSRRLSGVNLSKLSSINRRNKHPYYADRYAREVIPLLDFIIERKSSIDIKYKDFYPNTPETHHAAMILQQDMALLRDPKVFPDHIFTDRYQVTVLLRASFIFKHLHSI